MHYSDEQARLPIQKGRCGLPVARATPTKDRSSIGLLSRTSRWFQLVDSSGDPYGAKEQWIMAMPSFTAEASLYSTQSKFCIDGLPQLQDNATSPVIRLQQTALVVNRETGCLGVYDFDLGVSYTLLCGFVSE